MSDVVIRAENLSKRYSIGQGRCKDDGLRHRIEHLIRSPWNWAKGGQTKRSTKEDFWALRDLSFEVRTGEVLGVIGRNGAGKSTLLKVLSRIVEPTSGRVRIGGRVSSLLEVGTGFHPELTGRENVFLNGAILGMSKIEIRKKFDQIVAFAQIEKFLDTPVKRYSSGMYVRLAFAVAAHLEPEILIVDEVLAVGDAEFQKKCLNQMGDVARSGRTVLLVSHSMQAVTRLCTRCLLLEEGKVKMVGAAAEVANAYLNSGSVAASVRRWPDLAKAPGDDVVRLRSIRTTSKEGAPVDTSDIRRPVGIMIEYEVLKPGHVFHPMFELIDERGVLLFAAQDVDPAWRGRPRPVGRFVSTGWIPGNFLSEGLFSVSPSLMTFEPVCFRVELQDTIAFRVVDSLNAKDTARGDFPKPIPGLVRPLLDWTTQQCNQEIGETLAACKSLHASTSGLSPVAAPAGSS